MLDAQTPFHFALGDQSGLRSAWGEQREKEVTTSTPRPPRSSGPPPPLSPSSRLSDIIRASIHHFPLVSHSIHLSKYLHLLSSSSSPKSRSAASATRLEGNLIWDLNFCQPVGHSREKNSGGRGGGWGLRRGGEGTPRNVLQSPYFYFFLPLCVFVAVLHFPSRSLSTLSLSLPPLPPPPPLLHSN